jgi:hypothetical protein
MALGLLDFTGFAQIYKKTGLERAERFCAKSSLLVYHWIGVFKA